MNEDNLAVDKPYAVAFGLLILLAFLFGVTRVLKFRFVMGVGD